MTRRLILGAVAVACLVGWNSLLNAALDPAPTAQAPGQLSGKVVEALAVNKLKITVDGKDVVVFLAGVNNTGFEVNCDTCEPQAAHAPSECQAEKKTGSTNPGDDLQQCDPEVQTYRSQTAWAFTRDLVGQEKVKLTLLQQPKNPGQEWVALVYRESDDLFINYSIVRMGYAQVSEAYAFPELEEFRFALQKARAEKIGLWGAPLPQSSGAAPQPAHPSRE